MTQKIPYWHGIEPVCRIDLPEKWPWEEKMTQKIKVPEGMIEEVFRDPIREEGCHSFALEVIRRALRWLSENLPPTAFVYRNESSYGQGWNDALDAVRKIFLAPEEELPAELRSLTDPTWGKLSYDPAVARDAIIAAYKLGLRDGRGK